MRPNFNNYINKLKKVVLVVDDELINREILKAILEEKFKVVEASNGNEALEIIRKEEFYISAILLDINMPVMNGFEFLKEIKADEKFNRIPVLVLTADKNAEIESLTMGAHDFVAKPYVNEVVLTRVVRAIELFEDRTIKQIAERDSLTKAYSKNIFIDYAKIVEKYNPLKKMDMVVINISHFHLIREIHGSKVGESVLIKLADSLRLFASKNEGIVGRGFADYFLLYLKRIEDYSELVNFVYDEFEKDFPGLHIRIRYGIYECNLNEEMEERVDHAKNVCDYLREQNHTDYMIYNDELKKSAVYNETLIHDFKNAIEEKEFIVFFQPKYNVEKERIVLGGAEALVRWQHPEFGLILPYKFIDLFESNGLIRQLDEYVWNETAKQIHEWNERYNINIPVSVNVSRVDLYDDRLEKKLLNITNKYGIDNSMLHLEITESAYSKDTSLILNKIKNLKNLGFEIEMDDFGTGYSSLNMLTKMPFDYLKLDRGFIMEIANDEKNYKMVKLIITMAKTLNAKIVAEGVEFENQVKLLKDLQCNYIQGFYFSKPVRVDEFEKFIEGEK